MTSTSTLARVKLPSHSLLCWEEGALETYATNWVSVSEMIKLWSKTEFLVILECVELYLSKGFPDHINLEGEGLHWNMKIQHSGVGTVRYQGI